jgi:hypothetical protein
VNPAAAIRAISGCREASVRKAFKNMICTLEALRSPAQLIRCIFSRVYTHDIPTRLEVCGMYASKYLGEECTDGSAVGWRCWSWRRTTWKQRRGRALTTRRPTCRHRADPRGDITTHATRVSRQGLAASIPISSRRPKTMYGGFRMISVPPRSFGSGNGDHALSYCHPLSLSLCVRNTIAYVPRAQGKH